MMGYPQQHDRTWLLVEDDTSTRWMLAGMTLLWDRHPLVFTDGYQAMQWLAHVEVGGVDYALPELALLDIRLPGPQGYEIAARMRGIPELAETTIVLLTAYPISSLERERIETIARPNCIIEKPLPYLKDFREMLEEIIQDCHNREKSGDQGTT